MNKIAIFHRSVLVAQTLAIVLKKNFGYETEVGSKEPIMSDVAIIDFGLSDGLPVTITESYKESRPDTKLIGLLSAKISDRSLEAIALGVSALVLEEASLEELVSAIQGSISGQASCSNALIGSLFAQLRRNGAICGNFGDPDSAGGLTRRELEIMELVSRRLSNKEIARKLKISVYTVKNHVHHILEKLGAEDRLSAVEIARRGEPFFK